MVREFFERMRQMPAEIKADEQQLKWIEAEAINISSPQLGDKVQTSPAGGLEIIVSRVETQKEKIQKKKEQLEEMRDIARRVIQRLTDPRQRNVLSAYYIWGHTCESIANDIGYSEEKSVRRTRDRAIFLLESMPGIQNDLT